MAFCFVVPNLIRVENPREENTTNSCGLCQEQLGEVEKGMNKTDSETERDRAREREREREREKPGRIGMIDCCYF